MTEDLICKAEAPLWDLPGPESDVKRFDFEAQKKKMRIYYLNGGSDSLAAARLISDLRLAPDPSGCVFDALFTSVEHVVTVDGEALKAMVLSGLCVIFAEGEDKGAAADLRSFPQRSIQEPDKSKTLRGSHEGFTESLAVNIALIRKRIKSPRLKTERIKLGSVTATDAAIVYLEGKAQRSTLEAVRKKLSGADIKAVSMAQETVASLLAGSQRDPFPRMRFVERPDTASAMLLEGKVIVITDTSPAAIALPISVFDFFEETDDYYFPTLTGSYMRFIRLLVFIATVYLAPLWLWATSHADTLPQLLRFVGKIDGEYTLPIFLQLLVIEFAIDGLKLASLNTPSTLSNSLSVVGGLLLGDYAVKSGWFVPQTILYSAFTAMANFVPSNLELGYCFKFARMILIVLTQLFGLWGILGGTAFFVLILCLTRTVDGKSYLYPLFPFDAKALKKILFRSARGREEE